MGFALGEQLFLCGNTQGQSASRHTRHTFGYVTGHVVNPTGDKFSIDI